MAKRRNIIPGGYPEFNAYITLVLPYIIANAARLLIQQANIDVLQTLIEKPDKGWNVLYAQHAVKTSKTMDINNDLEAMQFAITKMLQLIYNDILRSKMITQDFIVLNITKKKQTKKRRGKIKYSPIVFMTSSGGAVIKFKVNWTAAPGRASMAPLADAIRVVGMILKPGDALPTKPQKCNITFTSRKALFDHTFDLSEAGNMFVCFVQYVNECDESKNGTITGLKRCIIAL